MFIEQPPLLYRILYPKAIWRKPIEGKKVIYLTFDDGPIPEVTPWVLDILEKYNVKATFFCVGDNVRKYPEIYRQVLAAGHTTGNHTFNHWQGWKHTTTPFMDNVRKAEEFIESDLFRPPHGHIRNGQYTELIKKGYSVIMWDVVTRDYNSKLTPERVFNNVKKYTRDGSIITFHDSLKSVNTLKIVLLKAIEWLQGEGYEFHTL